MIDFIHPAFPDCDHCIVFCADDNYMPLTAVAIQSIIEARNPSSKYDILLFHSGVSSEHMSTYNRMFGNLENVSVRFVNVQEIVKHRHFYAKKSTFDFSQEAYYRLFTPWVLDENYHRALYLDGDMIVLHDIEPLFQIDLGDNLIAGCRDYGGILYCYVPGDDRREYWTSIGVSNVDDYIISATILFNLEAVRAEFTLSEVLSKCTSRKWRQHDQDVVNIMCGGKIKIISPTWGFVPAFPKYEFLPQHLQGEYIAIKDPAICHFAGPSKPHYGWESKFNAHFWVIASHTPYFNDMLEKCNGIHLKWRVKKALEDMIGKTKKQYLAPMQDSLALCRSKTVELYGRLEIIRIVNQVIHVEGRVVFEDRLSDNEIPIFLSINGKKYPVEMHYTENSVDKVTGKDIFRGEEFAVDYALDSKCDFYTFHLCVQGGEKTNTVMTLFMDKLSPISDQYVSSYYYSEGWVVQRDKNIIAVRKCTQPEHKKLEMMFRKELLLHGGVAGKKAVLLRPLVQAMKKKIKKPIWLISDRAVRADDNGEAIFRYLNSERKDEIDSYFLIARESPDYERMKQYGKVVPLYSYRHKVLSMLADWSVASHVDEAFFHPFYDYRNCYADLLNHKRFAFLQHGVLSPDKDASTFLKRSSLHLDGFVASAQNEYNLIRYGKYHYDKEIWLTGLPRFDKLKSQSEKIITIMPTWRKNLTDGPVSNGWRLKPGFKDTQYATFYRELMQHPRLKSAAEQHGYTVQFRPHPAIQESVEMFGFGPNVRIVPNDQSYKEIYSRSGLLVTDYSSSIFDFLYLRKPVMYCQFDRDTFYEGHIYHGGEINYERDGFGEVESDLESTVDRIIEYMENGCRLKPKYRERIDGFFAFHDRDNCKRVTEKILELSKTR